MRFREWYDESRTPKEVFADHLRLRQDTHDRVENDLARNFSDDVIVQTNFGTFRGKDGVRKCAGILKKQLPCANYEYNHTEVKGNKAELNWTAKCNGVKVENGYDTFEFDDKGKIVRQNIYYTVQRAQNEHQRWR